MPTPCRSRSEPIGGTTDVVADDRCIAEVFLDEAVAVRRGPRTAHDLRVALFDLKAESHFDPGDEFNGPFTLNLAVEENRLILDIRDRDRAPVKRVALPLASFRSLIRDYFTLCESYYTAIKTLAPSRIEAIDMGRRGLHDEGAERLRDRLARWVAVDAVTARRLFTLICVLHARE